MLSGGIMTWQVQVWQEKSFPSSEEKKKKSAFHFCAFIALFTAYPQKIQTQSKIVQCMLWQSTTVLLSLGHGADIPILFWHQAVEGPAPCIALVYHPQLFLCKSTFKGIIICVLMVNIWSRERRAALCLAASILLIGWTISLELAGCRYENGALCQSSASASWPKNSFEGGVAGYELPPAPAAQNLCLIEKWSWPDIAKK